MPANSSQAGPTSTAEAAPAKTTERLAIDTIRALAMDAVQQANAGHPGTAMALAPLGYTLYRHFLRVNPANPAWPDRDRFVLSAGHACILQYALLHLCGFPLSLEDLRAFRQWGSKTPGHPERGVVPGVEVTTGPLGQGIANAVGMAIAERHLAEFFNRPGYEVVDHRTFVICSDGDLMEGISQEAATLAGHFGLGKLIVCYDCNRITIDGTTSLSFDGEDHLGRFAACGWHVQAVDDVEDTAALRAALEAAIAERERPSFIQVRSHIAYPAPHATDTAKAHGAPLGEEEVRATKEVLGFDPDRTFYVPDDVYADLDLHAKGRELEEGWRGRFERWAARYPQLKEEWERCWRGELRPGWQGRLPTFAAGEKIATRAAGAKAMAAIAPFGPTMVGGAADLVESTRTAFPGAGTFGRVHAGRNIPFGVREHAMGAIVNGAAAHGGIVKPYGSTFLIFSDYMRPAIRLSALMELPVVWVYSHDSIGLGEDGPTHQPVEQLAALRAIPNLWVIRPSDANETSVAWRIALEREDGPVLLALTRQAVPVIERSPGMGQAGELARGGYVLWQGGGPLQLVMIATGSEVAPTLTAARELAEQGLGVRVVAMPCLELFERQDREYRQEVLGNGRVARIAVEAGVADPWWRWVGEAGEVISLERYGASAPGSVVLEKLGFSAAAIKERAAALLGRGGGGSGR